MRHILPWPALLALLLGASCARSSAVSTHDAGAAGVVSSETSHDFGVTTEGDTLQHVFVLTNSGTRAITLDRVQPAHSAIKAVIDTPQLAPGATAKLAVSFDTLEHPGDHDKLITVASSDPSVPPTKLRVRARVAPLLEVEQEEEESEEDEDVRFGETRTREFRILGKKAGQVKLEVERVTHPDATAEVVTKSGEGGVTQEIKVTVQGKKLGHFHAGVFLRTNLPNKPVLKHFFEWSVIGNVQVVPRSLHFDIGGPSARQEKTSELKSRLDGFTVKGATSDSPAFQPSVQRSASGKSWELRVVASDPESLAKIETAKIEVTTNDPIQPMIVVPLTVSRYRPPPVHSARPIR